MARSRKACSWIHQCSERLLTSTWMLKVLLLKKGKLVVKFCFQASGIPVFTISVEFIKGLKETTKEMLRNTVLLNHDSSSWMMAMDTSSLPGRFRDLYFSTQSHLLVPPGVQGAIFLCLVHGVLVLKVCIYSDSDSETGYPRT